ncbi:D-Ala-D-Ala carboxypeptidase family metallohydrolase [Aeromonas veronii]|uniref:D-Ala-D-Ala carboxypeptidase family metallohydrolase n=1 Tax=Aeromonas veronii TaxID=654 RepID=UPI003D1C163F
MNKFFRVSEFACKCGCGFDSIDRELVALITAVRLHFKEPVTITSGCRCASHNKAVGGAVGSKHLEGIAADIQVKNVAPKAVQAFLNELLPRGRYGIGYGRSFTHLDTRPNGARFEY